MLCPKCNEWIEPELMEEIYICNGCCISFNLKLEVAKNIENFVYTNIERVMATRIDYMPMPRGTGLPIYI